MNEKSIYHLFRDVCEKNKNKVAFRFKKNGEWVPITWAQHAETCKSISKSLLALGVKKDDKVNILSQSRLEWVQCDFGAVSIGAVTVGIYPSNLADDCAYIINHSDAVIIFVENQDQLNKIISVRKQLTKIKHIVLYDGVPSGSNEAITWQDFLKQGVGIADEVFSKRAESLKPADVASIVYTSGTTGVPKGAVLTHGNLLFTSWSAAESLYLLPHMETLMFLPLAHVFARLIVYFSMRTAISIAFAESMEKVADNLKEIRPHFIASVPRIFEKVYDKITSGVQDAGGLKENIFRWSVGVGYHVSRLLQQKKSIPLGLSIKHKIANKLVLSKIQAAFGGRLVWAVSGAAPLNKAIAEFFHACGILILEGIGMTENSSFTNVNRYNNNKFGTVGPTGPGIEQKIAPDGEVLYRAKNVMLGYYKNPKATEETIDKDGWLYTGDIGEIDEDGFLRITDRKKDLIVTAGGKNIAPQRIERILRTSRYISQVIAVGDKKKFISALITLDQPQVEAWAKKQGINYSSWPELVAHPHVKTLIEAEVAEKNKDLASFESVKKFSLVPSDFSIASGELTASLKIKRKVVTERYRDLIEAMYKE
jgi:long-chain acyl-CoA synthetase